jgi:hypothetical protein
VVHAGDLATSMNGAGRLSPTRSSGGRPRAGHRLTAMEVLLALVAALLFALGTALQQQAGVAAP